MPPRVNTLNWCHFAFELTNQNSPGGKIVTPWRQCMLQQERYLSRVAFSLESALKIHQKDLEFKKQYRILKSEKYEKLCLQSLNMQA